MFLVTCNALQLANASAEPVNGETTIDYEDIVEFQCKESYSGMHTMYICTQSGILEPVQESGPINCVLGKVIKTKSILLSHGLHGLLCCCFED